MSFNRPPTCLSANWKGSAGISRPLKSTSKGTRRTRPSGSDNRFMCPIAPALPARASKGSNTPETVKSSCGPAPMALANTNGVSVLPVGSTVAFRELMITIPDGSALSFPVGCALVLSMGRTTFLPRRMAAIRRSSWLNRTSASLSRPSNRSMDDPAPFHWGLLSWALSCLISSSPGL